MLIPEKRVRLDSADIRRLNLEHFSGRVEVDRADVYVFHGEFFCVVLVLDVCLHG